MKMLWYVAVRVLADKDTMSNFTRKVTGGYEEVLNRVRTKKTEKISKKKYTKTVDSLKAYGTPTEDTRQHKRKKVHFNWRILRGI